MVFFFLLLFCAILLSPFFFSFLIVRNSRRSKGQASLGASITTAIHNKTLTKNNLLALAYGSVFAGFLTWYLCEPGHLGTQAPLLGGLLSVLALISTRMFGKNIRPETYAIFAAAVIILSFTAIRASDSLITINILFGYAALLIGLTSLVLKPFKEMNIIDYIFAQTSPIGSLLGIGGLLQSASKLFARAKPDQPAGQRLKRKIKINKEIAIGAAIAVPLLAIFTLLFASADSTFSSLIPSINFSNWNLSISPRLTWALFTTVTVGLFVASLLFYALVLSDDTGAKPQPVNAKKLQQLPKTSALIVLGSTVALFVLFCATQLPIIFGADVLGDSASLSENARRGFSQLVFASVIVFALLAGIEHYVPKKQVDSRFKALSLGLVFLTFIVLASAFMRLLATEAEYGFTVVRFFGHTYMILLGVWLAILAVKMTLNFSWSHFSQLVAISVFGCVLILNVINPEHLIAQTNINRADIRTVDTLYLSRLSTDAWPAIEEGIENGVFSQDEANGFVASTCNDYRHRTKGHDWRSWNKSIQDYDQRIDKYLDGDDCPPQDFFFDRYYYR